MIGTFSILWPISFLAVAVVDDLLFKKFHNWLFVSLSCVGLAYVFFTGNLSLWESTLGFITGGIIMLPLVLGGAIGGGDMKFMMSFGIIMGTNAIFEIFLHSLFWGLLIGALQILLSGRLKKVQENFQQMAVGNKPQNLHKIPYTVAIFGGWLSFTSFGGLL
ncbi:MAG: prepilin peptidase [Pseudomonadota bacterium]